MHWRQLAFCLAQLPYKKRALQKLQENMKCYSDKLTDEHVFAFFEQIIASARKNPDAELLATLDEMETILVRCHQSEVRPDELDKLTREFTEKVATNKQAKRGGGGGRRKGTRAGKRSGRKSSQAGGGGNESSDYDSDERFVFFIYFIISAVYIGNVCRYILVIYDYATWPIPLYVLSRQHSFDDR